MYKYRKNATMREKLHKDQCDVISVAAAVKSGTSVLLTGTDIYPGASHTYTCGLHTETWRTPEFKHIFFVHPNQVELCTTIRVPGFSYTTTPLIHMQIYIYIYK